MKDSKRETGSSSGSRPVIPNKKILVKNASIDTDRLMLDNLDITK